MDFNDAFAANADTTNASVAPIVIDTSAWVLKRDDEKRFERPLNATLSATRTRNPFYAAKGNAALRSVVVNFL